MVKTTPNLNEPLLNTLKSIDDQAKSGVKFPIPPYSPATHFVDLTKSKYFYNLILLRHIMKLLSDDYMSRMIGAKNVDLFMLTPSVSSPMGPGSDSEAIPIQFGGHETFLVDSSQFGFEPLIINGFEKVYCYLPSMRGENPDKRHLNQFFHCEVEIKGDLNDVTNVAEGYVIHLASGLLACPRLLKSLSRDVDRTTSVLEATISSTHFKQYTFSEACNLLGKFDGPYVNKTAQGRDISSAGEIKFMEEIGTETPIWLTHFDRSRVPFYQKPDPNNSQQVLNADILFPPINKGSFGGEVLGAGQRQDDPNEMIESLKLQGIKQQPYDWYIELRKTKEYATSSGFGLGIERFISWTLGLENIRDAIIYPRLKNELTIP